jgi:4-hydroxybenzoate polyprenyltransferase
MVVMYDTGLKFTWSGPLAMGWCRTLNVLLGASVADDLSRRYDALGYALAIGLYTIGLTYLARRETAGTVGDVQRTRRLVTKLIQGFIVIDAIAATAAAGWSAGLIVLALLVPTLRLARTSPMT